MKTLHLSIIVILATSLVIVGNNVFADNTTTAHGGLVGFHQAYFKSDHGNYPIWYKITNGTVISTPLDLPAKTLVFEINATSDGQLTVELPRSIIDSKNGSQDKPYHVTTDNIRSLGFTMGVLPEELSDKDLRILQINFTRDTSEIGISGTYFVENHPFIPQKLESPLKQFRSGTSAFDILCNGGLQLILKIQDNSPACVKLDTVKKLIDRGWGASIKPYSNTTILEENKNNGTLSGVVSAYVYGGPLSTLSPNRSVHYEVDVYATDGVTIVGKTLSDANAHYSIQLPSGNYIIYTYNDTKQTHLVSVSTGKNTVFNILSSINVP